MPRQKHVDNTVMCRVCGGSGPSTMDVFCRWEVLLVTLWIQASFTPGLLCNDGVTTDLSREDVLLLSDQKDPKCFTRTADDFTCFFETADNRTSYDLLYEIEGLFDTCPMSAQTTEEGTVLNVCSFPDNGIYVFANINLKVVERNTSVLLYSRNVSVEDNFFLDPPSEVSLHENDQAGQLQVSWATKDTMLCQNKMHRIRCSSKTQEKIKTVDGALDARREGVIIDALESGEEVQVQVSAKCSSGYWSRWSHPVQHMVPQHADDVSLICFTLDLQNITCEWNGSKYGEETGYGLFYKTRVSHTLNWTEWTKCLGKRNVTGACHFVGDMSREVLVRLSEHPAPLSKTFYTQKFTMNNSIKTSPPHHLRATLENDKLCLRWEAPLLLLSAHLKYEVSYPSKRGEERMASLDGPATETCLEVVAGTKYSVKVRAKPRGSTYAGHWSDWSEVLPVDTPADIGTTLILHVTLVMVIVIVIGFVMLSMYFRKLKQYFWPPVPNLDKVLQGFLAEINGQKWDLSVTAKQCPEETMSSVVEILSQEDISGLGQQSPESSQLLSPEGLFSSKEKLWSSGTEIFPDYVTLNKDSAIICPKGNNYVYEQVVERVAGQLVVGDVLLQTRCCSCTASSCLCTQYLNHSYLHRVDRLTCMVTEGRGPGNPYTNFPCS